MRYSGTPTQDFRQGKPKKVKINLNSVDSINKSIAILGGTADDIKQALYEEVERLCQIGEDTAKAKVHVKTGALKGSIKHKVKRQKKKIHGVVSAGTDHAMFHEFGTGLIGKDSNYPGNIEGWVYDYKGQEWQGHACNPYMYEAAKAMEKEIKK